MFKDIPTEKKKKSKKEVVQIVSSNAARRNTNTQQEEKVEENPESEEAKPEREELVETGTCLQGTGIWTHDAYHTNPISAAARPLLHLFARTETGVDWRNRKVHEDPTSAMFTRRKQEDNLCQSTRHCGRAETIRRAHHTQFLFAEMCTSGSILKLSITISQTSASPSATHLTWHSLHPLFATCPHSILPYTSTHPP